MALEYILVPLYVFAVVKEKYELAKKVWEYLRMFPEWLIYLEQLDGKKETLNQRMGMLSSVVEDITVTLKNEEQRSKKKRRSEVNVWLENAKRIKTEVEAITQDISQRKHLKWPPLGYRIDMLLTEVTDHREKGSFSNGLFLDVPPGGKEPLLTQELVGHDRFVEKILEWLVLVDLSVLRIGVYGENGVGKTAVLTHVQSRLSQSTTFDQVYWVSTPKGEPCVEELQDVIAKQAGMDLSEETNSKIRAANLHALLAKRGKCVIILDGLKNLPIEEVGIQNCTLVLSTLTLRDCKRMDCRHSLEIEPLSDRDALVLFKKKSGSATDNAGSEFDEIVEHVVRECQRLPAKIIALAERLRGVDDINEWIDVLNDVTQKKTVCSD